MARDWICEPVRTIEITSDSFHSNVDSRDLEEPVLSDSGESGYFFSPLACEPLICLAHA